MEQVIWKDIPGFEGRYQASNTGMIRSLDVVVKCRGNGWRVYKGRIKPQYKNNRGYATVNLCVDNVSVKKLVHRLVAETFIDNPLNKTQVNHKDENIENNNIENLEWVTDDENKMHSSIASGGTQRPKRSVIVVDIKSGYGRVFDGLREAERTLGIDHGSAMKVLNGRHRQTKGFWLSYIGGDENAKTDNSRAE